MAKRRRQERVGPSRKEQRMTKAEQAQARRLTIVVGIVLGVALLVLIGGLLFQLVLTPASAVAEVNGVSISTRDFWDRVKFEQSQTENQLVNLLNLRQQFASSGDASFFDSQIRQLQATLADSEGLANQVLEQMIDEQVIAQAAAEAGIVATDQEINTELDGIVASGLGGVTVPEATSTAEALAVATPTATFTPSPTPTTTVASTATVVPTLAPQPTPTLLVVGQDELASGLENLYNGVEEGAGISRPAVEKIYRSLIALNLVQPRLTEAISDTMPTSGPRVQASHILISLAAEATDADRQAALAEAISITQRLRDGEDFATLAEQYSDDPGSAANGGDLGFFGRGQMVPEFEEAAFSLPIDQISDPVLSQFGYHIIKVTARDDGDPDFNAWLQERKAAIPIVRNLTSARLPTLPALNPALFQDLTPAVVPTPAAVPTPTVAG